MQDEPTATELLKAVADFLRNDITPEISGHLAFKLRVAINALDLVTRQLALEPGSDAAENERLSRLLGTQGRSTNLTTVLAARIAGGDADLQTPGLAEHLWADDACQARGRSAELCELSKGDGREVIVPITVIRDAPLAQARECPMQFTISGSRFARPGMTIITTSPSISAGAFRKMPSAPRYNPATPPSPSPRDSRAALAIACSRDTARPF